MKQLNGIKRSIVALKKQLRGAEKELNQEAANMLSKGKYEASSALIEIAKRTRGFVEEVELLREKWAALRGKKKKSDSPEKTPLWEYYRLIARAIVAHGGEAVRAEIVNWMEKNASLELKPGDLERTGRGRLIWERNLGRGRKAMLVEGYLEPQSGNRWKLTSLGRDLAAQKSGKNS